MASSRSAFSPSAARNDEPAHATVEAAREEIAIAVRDIGKCYEIYGRPIDRLKQTLWHGRRQFFREFWALRHVSFEVRRGQAVGIIGRNGSGKSTLLQIIAGTLRPTEGDVRVHGRVHAILELGSGFNPEFTGRENVYLNGAILGLNPSEIADRFDAIAGFADIGEFIDQPIKTYSTGMVMRLAFAVQATLDPDILIVDEALAVGDASFQRRCYRRLDELREQGVVILFVSHSLELVRSICDTAIYLERGQVKAQGDTSRTCDAYLTDLLAEQVSASPPARPPSGTPTGDGASEDPGCVLSRYDARTASRDRLQGSLALEVVAAELRLPQRGPGVVYEGDRVAVVARLRANQPQAAFVFGVLIRDRYGTDIFGFSKRSQDLGVSALDADGEVVIETVIKCDLRADTYFITLGVQGEQFSEILCYAHDALPLTIESRADPSRFRMIGGLVRLDHSIAAARVSS